MMLARYLVLPSVLLELALAAGNSSVPESTSTIQITSFITQTAPNPTSNSASYLNGTGLEYASSCNQVKLDWVENRGQTYVSNTTFTTSTDSLRYANVILQTGLDHHLTADPLQLHGHSLGMDRDVRRHASIHSLRWVASNECEHDLQDARNNSSADGMEHLRDADGSLSERQRPDLHDSASRM